MKILKSSLLGAVFLAGAASAGLVTDAPGDFLPTFGGPNNGDLDVLSTRVLYTGSEFVFEMNVNGPIGTTPGAVYIWGVNRGAAAVDLFPGVADGVRFDWAVAVQIGGFAIFSEVGPNAVPQPLPAGSVEYSGNFLRVSVDATNLPSTGFAPGDYTFSFWPRSGLTDIGNVVEISDFAPNEGMAPVSAVPEPSTGALILGAVGAAIAARRNRRK